jgi:acetyl esterase/lipase
MNRVLYLIVISIFFVSLNSCAFRRIRRSKHIVYQQAAGALPRQELNVFAPRRMREAAPVMLFIHGGNWNSGRKELYSWFGSRLARKGIVTVVMDYPLSPAVNYRGMAQSSAEAVRWIQQNISAYGGDPARIFISGHSAGGHLAALLGTDTSWLQNAGVTATPRGLILIDAAGLNMYSYLKAGGIMDLPTYPLTFGVDPEGWKAATPLLFLHPGVPPMLILTGGRSYPSIIVSNDTFIHALRAQNLKYRHVAQPRRKHVPMITQFFRTGNPRYGDMLQFMRTGNP